MNHIQIVGCHEFCQLVPHCCLHLRDGCPSQLSNSQENHAIFQYGFLQYIFRVPIRNRVHCEGVGQRSRFQSLPRFARSRSVCTTTLRELRVRVHCWTPVLEVEHGLVLRLSSRLMGCAAGSTLLEPPPFQHNCVTHPTFPCKSRCLHPMDPQMACTMTLLLVQILGVRGHCVLAEHLGTQKVLEVVLDPPSCGLLATF